ncbi:hypothetical protein DSO57_1006087 [Entomophthora muscae]|uniref:Uncharacterized protein n=1 Tax=Entomophthora muscae TaxID=34485 RepID=A0ACC2SWT7_9FUNG|nr:hypothetical protein DSO57_1006087 [Entomophthora muscae]
MSRPHPKIKKIIKAFEPNYRLSQDLDVFISLNYEKFLKRLMTEAKICAYSQNSNVVYSDHIEAVMEKVLQEFRG